MNEELLGMSEEVIPIIFTMQDLIAETMLHFSAV